MQLYMRSTNFPDIKFRHAFIVAIFLHIFLIALYALVHSSEIIEVPFKSINVRIGKQNVVSDEKNVVELPEIKSTPVSKPRPKKESGKNDLKKGLVPEKKKPQKKPVEVKKSVLPQKTKTRNSNKTNAGLELGNKKNRGSESITSYEQELSLWIEKTKVLS